MLLPDNVFWEILKSAASNKGILPEDAGLLVDDYEFWPKWNPNSIYDTGNSSFVEPDVFFRFGNIDVIVEAKYSDSGGQYREEWEREFKAYLNTYKAGDEYEMLEYFVQSFKMEELVEIADENQVTASMKANLSMKSDLRDLAEGALSEEDADRRKRDNRLFP